MREQLKLRSIFRNIYGEFGTIGFGQIGLVFKASGNDSVAGFVSIAEFVEVEQFRRQRLATTVPLAFVLIDMNSEFTGHEVFPCSLAPPASSPAF